MLKDITLGQYFPGNTIIHRLDPRVKIVAVVFYIAALFLAKNAVSYGIMIIWLAGTIYLSKIKLKSLFRGLKPIVVIVIITAILNLFYTSGDVLAKFWIFTITKQGIRSAVFIVLRIVMLLLGTFLLTYTTAPMNLTDGLESLLGPLKKIRMPVHEMSMMMSIALRFIPTLIEETNKIMNAQKARGADFETGNIFKRAKALVPILVPLFISAFRRADELAVAMECRCYAGDNGRTKMKQLRMEGKDWTALALCTAVTALVLTLGALGF